MKKGVLIAVILAVIAASAAGGYLLYRKSAGSTSAGGDLGAVTQGQATTLSAADKARLTAERRHLWREASYADIRQKAQEGNAMAQRRLSEIYEDCLSYRSGLNTNLTIVSQMSTVQPNVRATVEAILAERERMCPYADAEMRARGTGVAAYWLHQSAKRGDLTAEIRYFTRSVPQVKVQQTVYLVNKVAASGDPDAIFEVSSLLGRTGGHWPDQSLRAAFEGPYADQAWAIAACREGLDCARGSRVIKLMCLSMFACQYPDYETLLFSQTTYSGKKPEVDAVVNLIRQQILAKGRAN